MSIKKGLFGADDYVEFGKMYDVLEEAGAYLIVYVPRKRMVVISCRDADVGKVISVVEDKIIEKKQLRNKTWIVKIKV